MAPNETTALCDGCGEQTPWSELTPVGAMHFCPECLRDDSECDVEIEDDGTLWGDA